jgi:hypothetical protein
VHSPSSLPDRFTAKTWIFWAQLIILGWLGGTCVVIGLLSLAGKMKDVQGQVRRDAGIPATLVGGGMLGAAALAGATILGHRRPVIRCFREGLECNLVGASALDDVPLLPGLLRVTFSIVSLQGFRSHQVRIPWVNFTGAFVQGLPMAYVLTVTGEAINVQSGQIVHKIDIQQVTLNASPQHVAEILNTYSGDPKLCKQLPVWPME